MNNDGFFSSKIDKNHWQKMIKRTHTKKEQDHLQNKTQK